MKKYPISLAAIRAAAPCESGWTTLLRSLGCPPRSAWDATYVTLGDLAASNGAADALWCVRCLPDEARRDVLRAILPSVKRAAAHTTDKRVHDCVEAVTAWCAGDDTVDLRTAWAASTAASTAAGAAAWAAAEARAASEAAAAAEVSAMRAAEAAAAVGAASAAAASAEASAAAEAAAAERETQTADIIAVFGRLHAHAAAA